MDVTVKVVPGASTDEICGWLGDALKLRVRAAPEQDRANKAMIALLARALAISEHRIEVVRGHKRPMKTVRIDGLDTQTLRRQVG